MKVCVGGRIKVYSMTKRGQYPGETVTFYDDGYSNSDDKYDLNTDWRVNDIGIVFNSRSTSSLFHWKKEFWTKRV